MKQYIQPTIELIQLAVEDILTSSITDPFLGEIEEL